MNNTETRAEAIRRVKNMPFEEKTARLAKIDAEEELIDLAERNGLQNLSEEQKDKFKSIMKERGARKEAMGLDKSAIEVEALTRFDISRDDIKNMAKNPYKAIVLRDALISMLLNVGTIVLGYYGIGIAMPAVVSASGLVATDMVKNIIKYSKYKKMQKKYSSDEFTEEEIEAKIYDELYETYKRGGISKC